MAKDAPKIDIKRLLGDSILRKVGGKTELQPTSTLDDQYLGIYFSAHWCPPCRGFTPQLANTYNKLKGKKPFEVVFVSSDRNVEAFAEYFDSMPWTAVPFGEYNLRKELSNAFEVVSIPKLVLLAPDGTVLNSEARSAVTRDPSGSAFPWHGSTSLSSGCDVGQLFNPPRDIRGALDFNKIVLALLVFYLLYRLLS